MEHSAHPRRRFLGRLAGTLAALTTGLPVAARADSDTVDVAEHDAWMKSLKGKHKQFFHDLTIRDQAMLMANNYLDAYTEAFGAKAGEANAVIGIHGPALSMGFNDAAWAKYGFGKMYTITDPATKEPAVRNLYATGGNLSIDTLQKRGVVFLMCNTALRLRSRGIAAERNESHETVYADLKASLLPGMILVPAMVVAINRAQEKGYTYIRV
ncbi:MAG TPA: hypothetical protein VM939_06660 [Gemmatimonadaceae bacterium]|nr:hypothetical protein [Gemmatimonadaceae bacterium]